MRIHGPMVALALFGCVHAVCEPQTRELPALVLTDSQSEELLRAVIEAELKWYRHETEYLERVVAGLDAGDDSWRPPANKTGSRHVRYLQGLIERRWQLLIELDAKRAPTGGERSNATTTKPPVPSESDYLAPQDEIEWHFHALIDLLSPLISEINAGRPTWQRRTRSPTTKITASPALSVAGYNPVTFNNDLGRTAKDGSLMAASEGY